MQAVFFFHPAVHLANWIIDELREYACDDAALAACKTSRRDCGEGFLAIVERSVERCPGGRAGPRAVRIADADPPPPDPHPRQSPHGPRAAVAAARPCGLLALALLVRADGLVARRLGPVAPQRRPRRSRLRDRRTGGFGIRLGAMARERGARELPAGRGLASRRGPGRGAGTRARSSLGRRAVVLALAYSPDGSILASAGDDAVVVLRDVASGRVVGRLEGHGDAVSCLAFSPDGRTLATGSYDRTVKLWDVASGREQATLTGHTNWVFAVAFSPDGKHPRLGGSRQDGAGLGRRPRAGRRRRSPGHSASVRAVAFAPDGERPPARLRRGGSPGPALGPGRPRASVPGSRGTRGRFAPWPSRPTAATLATGGEDGEVRLWDTASGRERASLSGHSDMVTCLAFSPEAGSSPPAASTRP